MALIQRGSISAQRHLIPDSLTHSGGVITAVINGQQFTRSIPGLAANTLYFLYLECPAGTPSISLVSTVPSQRRLVAPEAILIGAFYSTGASTPAFGTFCTIEGTPTTSNWFTGLTSWQASSGPLTKGTTQLDVTQGARVGNMFKYSWSYRHSTAGTGSGNLYLNMPSNITFSNNDWPVSNEWSASRGSAYITTTADGRLVHCFNPGGGLAFGFIYNSGSTNIVVSMTTHPYSNGGFHASGDIWIPIAAWSNTPLKDL